MSTIGADRPSVKATATSFKVLEAVHDHDGAGVTELARELDLAKRAVYKHLMTLTELRYRVKKDTTYTVGQKAIECLFDRCARRLWGFDGGCSRTFDRQYTT